MGRTLTEMVEQEFFKHMKGIPEDPDNMEWLSRVNSFYASSSIVTKEHIKSLTGLSIDAIRQRLRVHLKKK